MKTVSTMATCCHLPELQGSPGGNSCADKFMLTKRALCTPIIPAFLTNYLKPCNQFRLMDCVNL